MDPQATPPRGTTRSILVPGTILLALGIGGIMLTRFILPSLIAGFLGLVVLIYHRKYFVKPRNDP